MDFKTFLESFMTSWKNSSIDEMAGMISTKYQGREVRGGEIVDFGFEQSIVGWEEGFKFVLTNNGEWDIQLLKSFPLRSNEYMAIIAATIYINGKSVGSYNVFFDTFKKEDEWKCVRSYIETGISEEALNEMSFN